MSSATALQLAPRRQPTTVPPGPGSPARPALRVLEGGRAPGRLARRAVYRRRRLVALLLVLLVTGTLVVLANAVVARTAGGGTPASVAGTSAPSEHVVQPGDTLWSIARTIDPEGDVRVTVDRLVERNGGGPLVVGQRLELP